MRPLKKYKGLRLLSTVEAHLSVDNSAAEVVSTVPGYAPHPCWPVDNFVSAGFSRRWIYLSREAEYVSPRCRAEWYVASKGDYRCSRGIESALLGRAPLTRAKRRSARPRDGRPRG